MKYLKANTIGFQIEPSLDNEETKKFIRFIKTDFEIFTNYESREKENEHFFSNGPSISSENEIILKLSDNSNLFLAWGHNIKLEKINKLIKLLFDNKFDFLDKFRINAFDCGFIFGIDYDKNPYEIFGKAFYNDAINNFYSNIPNVKIRDNDIQIIMAHGKNQTISCSVTGYANRSEIETNEFEEKEIRFKFGILFEKVSIIKNDLTEEIINHHSYSKNYCEEYFYPTFVQKIIDCMN